MPKKKMPSVAERRKRVLENAKKMGKYPTRAPGSRRMTSGPTQGIGGKRAAVRAAAEGVNRKAALAGSQKGRLRNLTTIEPKMTVKTKKSIKRLKGKKIETRQDRLSQEKALGKDYRVTRPRKKKKKY